MMKRWTCLTLAVCLLLTFFGCSDPNQQSLQTDPLIAPQPSTEAMQPSTMDVTETNPPKEETQKDKRFPLLLGIQEEEKYVQMNYITWNVEKGQFSEPEPWYRVACVSVLDVLLSHWDGSSNVFLYGNIEPIATQVSTQSPKWYEVSYGRCVYVPEKEVLYQIDSAGTYQQIPLPRDPGNVYNEEKLYTEFDSQKSLNEPHYAGVDGDTGIAAFFAYDSTSLEGDVVYCTYPLDTLEAAVWNWVHIPLKYAMDAYVQRNWAYSNGFLYLASLEAILAIDLETGDLRVLDKSNTFAAAYALYPGATQFDGTYYDPIVISGCWDGMLLTEFPLIASDGNHYYFYVALQDGEAVGMLEKKENGSFTFYDGNGQVLGTDDRFQDSLAPLSMQFPRDD